MFQTDQFTLSSLRSAASLAELAIQKDSGYADAWAALAGAWGTLADDFVPPREALPHMRPAVQRALELDPGSAEVHAQAGVLHLFYDYDIAAARGELETALGIDSANGTAAVWLPHALRVDPGNEALAVKIRERGVRLNPGSPTLLRNASTAVAMRLLSDAERRARCKALSALDARQGTLCEGARLLLAGDTIAALALVRSPAASLPPTASGGEHVMAARALLTYGDTAGAQRELASAIAMSAREYVREDVVASVYFRLGDSERSIDWWRRAVESNGAQVIWLAKDPEFAPLRKDPRVQALLVKAGVR